MPRDANGDYTLPAGNPVVAGTTIQTSWANPTMDDLGAEIQDSLSRSGKGAMTAPLAITGAGTATVRLSNDGVNKAVLNSDGNAANLIGLQINGNDRLRVANSGPTAHIISGSSGVSAASTSADDLVIEGSATAGISILTPATNAGLILFGDPEKTNAGFIQYNHADDSLQFNVNDGTALVIDSSRAQTWTSNDAQRAVRSTGNNRNAITFDSGTGTASVGTSGTTFRLYAGEFVSTAGGGGGLSLNTGNGRITISDSTNLYGSGRLGVNVATTETTALLLLSRGVSTNNAILVTGGSGFTEEKFKVAFNGKATFLALHDIEPLSSGMRHFTSGRQMLALNNTGTSGAYTVLVNGSNENTDLRWNSIAFNSYLHCDANGGIRVGKTGAGSTASGAIFQTDWDNAVAYSPSIITPAEHLMVYNTNTTDQAYATLMMRVGSSGGGQASISAIKTGANQSDLAVTLKNTSMAEVFRLLAAGGVAIPLLPSTNPGAGSKQIWYDPSDGNRVKYAP